MPSPPWTAATARPPSTRSGRLPVRRRRQGRPAPHRRRHPRRARRRQPAGARVPPPPRRRAVLAGTRGTLFRVARTVIAHLDVDAFYASVELLRRPELRGKPVIVSGSGPRAVVTTASYEARALRRRLGDADVAGAAPVPGRRPHPARLHGLPRGVARVMDLVRGAGPGRALGLDEAYLDLSASWRRRPRCAAVTDDREATGLDASVGIGPNSSSPRCAATSRSRAGRVR